MARKHSDTAVLDAPPQQTNGEADERAGALADAMMDAASNGQDVTRAQSGVIPMTPEQVAGMNRAVQAKRERKARDPNAVRPMYQIQGMDRYSGAMRILLTAPTKGQARKLLPQAVQVGGELQGSPVIVQCRIVS